MKLKGEVKNAGLKLLRRDSNKIGINWICTLILPTSNKKSPVKITPVSLQLLNLNLEITLRFVVCALIVHGL